MAKFTASGVISWLRASKLSASDLIEIIKAAEEMLTTAREDEQELARALEKLDLLVKRMALNTSTESITSTRDLIARLDGLVPQNTQSKGRPGRKAGRISDEIRKPYMHPYDPELGIFAIKKGHPPPWAEKLLAEGWTLADLHYRRISAALRVRGEPISHDYVAIHDRLMIAERG